MLECGTVLLILLYVACCIGVIDGAAEGSCRAAWMPLGDRLLTYDGALGTACKFKFASQPGRCTIRTGPVFSFPPLGAIRAVEAKWCSCAVLMYPTPSRTKPELCRSVLFVVGLDTLLLYT